MKIKEKTRNRNDCRTVGKKIKKLLVFSSLLIGIIPATVFADSLDVFTVITKDEHGIPTSGFYNDNRYQVTNHEKVHDYITSINPNISKEQIKANPNLIYTRNGYGGGYVGKNKTEYDVKWSFNILGPRDATGENSAKIEDYYNRFIPMNRSYPAGPRSQAASGYPSVKDKYTKKLMWMDPVKRTFYNKNTGHMMFPSETRKQKKVVYGEYRFNGVSGNGVSLNNAFFPDDSPNWNGSPEWTPTKVTSAFKQSGNIIEFEKSAKKLIGEATWENKTDDIRDDALDQFFAKFIVGGKSEAMKRGNYEWWNKRVKIQNSPKVSSATFTFIHSGGNSYNSVVIPQNSINDLAIKSIVLLDVDTEGNLIRRADGSYQSIGEFSRGDNISSMIGDFRANAPMSMGKD